MLVLKLAGNTWENESRDKRELSVYKELGYDVLVMAKGGEKDNGRQETVDGYKVLRYSSRPLGAKTPLCINRFVSLFKWAHYVRKLKADVISAHDLLPALIIAWMSTWFQSNKPKLIYDCHEFELGRNTNGKRSCLSTFFIGKIEKFMMKRCAFSIMVNDSIADEVQRIHKLKERPIVVRSIPAYWDIDSATCEQTRQKLLQELNVQKNSENFIIMYHGAVKTSRGIETMFQLVSKNADIDMIVLGNGSSEYLETLKQMVNQLGIQERVLFHDAVPFSELWKYIGAVDLDMTIGYGGKIKSYYYGLPNKLFESIQAEVPIIASDYPELKRVIETYGVGLTCDPMDLDRLFNCIERFRTEPFFYMQTKENLKKAKKVLCWEQEKRVLVEAFLKS